MTGKDVAGIFEPALTFQHALTEVTKRSNGANKQPEQPTLQWTDQAIERFRSKRRKCIGEECADQDRSKHSGKIALPAFLRAETRSHFMFAIDRAYGVATRIGCPHDGQDNKPPPQTNLLIENKT